MTAAISRSAVRSVAASAFNGTANPDGPGLLLRGRESQPLRYDELDPRIVGPLIRLARLAGAVADALRDCPDPAVRRSAAILAARAHPIRAAFDD